jgi:uncharacterized protein YutD
MELDMVIETPVGQFELIKNYKDAFDIQKFVDKYVDVAFDRYTYIVGDIASDILRLKGFSQDPKGANGYKKIPDYLNESCNHNCPFFVLKRIKVTKSNV